MKTSASAIAICLGLLTPTTPVRAALPEPQADQIFKQGLEAFDTGEAKLAIELWEKLVTEGDPAKVWRVLYNLGLAYEVAGDRPRALERFEAFARRVGEQPGSLPIDFEGRRQDAVERSARIRPEVSMLRVTPSANGERVPIRINGGPSRDAGFALYLEPGKYELKMGEGVREKTASLELERGELFTAVAEQLPPPPAPPAKPPPPYQAPIPLSVLITGGALSTALVALPLGLFFRAKGLREDADAVGAFETGYPAALDAYDEARTMYLASWAVPGTLAAVTLGLLVVDVVDASGDSRARSARLRVGPTGGRVEVELW